jgi:hypothetical protein
MIYQPHVEESDWSEFTTMVQCNMTYDLVSSEAHSSTELLDQ